MNEKDELIGTSLDAIRLALRCVDYVRGQYANHGQDVLNLGNVKQAIDMLDIAFTMFAVGSDLIASADDESKDTLIELGHTLSDSYLEEEAE